MIFGVMWIFIMLFFLDFHTNAHAIDDKLDFGGSPGRSRSSYIADHKVHRSSFIPVKHSSTFTKVENTDDFDKIGIVCTDGGCNTTKSTSDSGDTVKTDVVVHIETKVDLKHNNTQFVDDTPDVPIVIGTDDSNPNRAEPKSIYIPGIQPNYSPSSGSVINSNSYGYLHPAGMSHSFPPSRRVDSGNDNEFDIDSGVNINIKKLPSVTVDFTDTNRNMVNANYMPNGVELTVPYFDPSLHNHYYGENPPPQFAFYPRRTSIMNPVEFKPMRSNWKPSTWQNQFNFHKHNIMPIPMSRAVQCPCQNEQTVAGLHLYPNSNRRSNVPIGRSSINDPGSQINDKLSPLN